LSSALKQKKEKEQVAPIGNHKVMSATVPAHQDQVVSHGNVVIVRDQGASFSMLPSSTSAPTHFVSEAELRQKQRR
jgi:hypothetical protein